MRNYIALIIGALIIISALIIAILGFGSQPPSDAALTTLYYEHQNSLTQLVQLYQQDQVGVIVHKNGSIFPAEAKTQLSSERLSRYKTLVKEIGVTRSLGGNAEGLVTFQIFNLNPLSPMKTIIHSPTPPPLITSGNTDDYTFAPEQYQRVCREIEDVWYVCLDYED